MKQAQKLELFLLNYFLLIVIAAVMIGAEFYFEMSDPQLKQEICISTTAVAASNESDENTGIIDINSNPPTADLTGLRNKIAIMFGVLTIVVAIVMMMFVKNITRPLQRTLDTARLINDGDLSQVIKIEAHDEVGQLGIVINDLTSNFQEIASSTLVMINAIEQRIEKLSSSIDSPSDLSTEQLNGIRQELDALQGFINSFNLLETDIGK